MEPNGTWEFNIFKYKPEPQDNTGQQAMKELGEEDSETDYPRSYWGLR